MTSYQKLKKRVAELERQLRIVVRDRDSPEASTIIYSVMFKDEIDRAIWFGTRTPSENLEGLLNHIDNEQ